MESYLVRTCINLENEMMANEEQHIFPQLSVEKMQSLELENAKLKESIKEQIQTIAALNAAINGEGSTTTENLTIVGRLRNQIEQLENLKLGPVVAYSIGNKDGEFSWEAPMYKTSILAEAHLRDHEFPGDASILPLRIDPLVGQK